ncbi:MAG TPA: LLM class flavin-dependent oxidoreductase [Pyrinomonadaceae bacterium]|nr:LLM class flavin-dependent oxidoreductase [Pyrinomonadaceae bacterium]
MQFSLLYFDGKGGAQGRDKYRLLLEGAKFADRNGFAAVWTPERHFHQFGGLYPNPAITSAALAAITERIELRAGSVVMPLQNPVRVAEEWAAVDNLSQGRVAISFAAGWHANDFALAPENYADRKTAMIRGIEAVRKLWRGEPVVTVNGLGQQIEVRTFPKPVQPELRFWTTCSGNPETFVLAGELGGGVLTHLLGQSIEELQTKIELYRDTLAKHGHPATAAHVTLMMHTFVGDDLATVRETVRQPFYEYLLSSISLIQKQLENSNQNGALPWSRSRASQNDKPEPRSTELTESEKAELAAYGFDRYFNTAALFGTPDTCLELVNRLAEIGVDEIACLIDFGVDAETALNSLSHLAALKERCRQESLYTELGRQEITRMVQDFNAPL